MRSNPPCMGMRRAVQGMPARAATAPMGPRMASVFSRSTTTNGRFSRVADTQPADHDELPRW